MSGTSSRTSSSTSALGICLEHVSRAWFEQQRVAGADLHLDQRLGKTHDALLVGVADDQGARAVGEQLLEHHDLADLLEAHDPDDVHRLVQHDLAAALELGVIDVGAHRHAELATAGEDVDGAVVERLEKESVTGRRLCQPVDLILHGDDLGARFVQGRAQAGVALLESGRAHGEGR